MKVNEHTYKFSDFFESVKFRTNTGALEIENIVSKDAEKKKNNRYPTFSRTTTVQVLDLVITVKFRSWYKQKTGISTHTFNHQIDFS